MLFNYDSIESLATIGSASNGFLGTVVQDVTFKISDSV